MTRLRVSIPFVSLLAAAAIGVPASAAPPDYPPSGITCRAYMVYNLTRDTVVATHNPEARQPVASLTKLMTGILAAERLRFDGRYVLKPEEAQTFGTDTMRADKMLEMALVCSNNGICQVISRIASGSEDNFVHEMNAKALQLGLTDTRFANSSGLPGGEQYSTMWDLVKLTRAAMSVPEVRRAMQGRYVELEGKTYDGTLNSLYRRHPGLVGGKTGWTRASGRCLTLWYQGRGDEYIVITLGSTSGKASFRDAELILRHYGLYTGPVGEWK